MILAKLILMVAMVSGNSNAVGAVPTSAPTSQPATQVTEPKQVIVDFLKGLEQLPVEERKGHARGNTFKAELSKYVSDAAVDSYSTLYGRGLANLSAEEIATLRESLVAAWASLIHYYQGYLMYDKARNVLSISMPGSTKPKPFRMVVPSSGPAYPGPVEVMVECIQENGVWKVNNVRLLPLARNKLPKNDSRN
jgi:hypothetical protein